MQTQTHVFQIYQKSSMLLAVGYQPLRIIINKTSTFEEIRKVMKIAWKVNPVSLRIFLTNGSEISEQDLPIVNQGSKLYVTLDGSDLDVNILFLTYSINDQLGQSLGSITLLGKQKSNKSKVILKSISSKHFLKEEFCELVQIIQKLKAEKMCIIVGIFEMLILESKGELWLITEFCDGVQLNILIQQSQQSEDVKLHLIKQLCEIVKQLHFRNIVIKNLKLENIFVLQHENQNDIKLTDIGYNNLYRILNQTPINLINYCSPELLHQQKFTQESDIWALGVIIYYLNFNQFPFEGKTKIKILQNIKELNYHNRNFINLNLQDLLKQIFTNDPQKRISAADILEHPYLQQKKRFYNKSRQAPTKIINLPLTRLGTQHINRRITSSQRSDSEHTKSNKIINLPLTKLGSSQYINSGMISSQRSDSEHITSNKIINLSLTRLNTHNTNRRMISRQRSDSEENNISIRRKLITENKKKLENLQSLFDSIKVISLLKKKPIIYRNRYNSQNVQTETFQKMNTKEF